MTKILGLDLGTNSIGWAVVESEDNKKFELLDKGVRIFQEGSTAKDRTTKRGIRRLYFRRRLRKIETLKLLSKYGYCPPISDEELNNWRKYKKYPVENIDFINWLRTDNSGDEKEKQRQTKNPYFFRFKAVKEPISKFEVGRAIYHLAQRRGFLSNSLSQENDELIVLVTDKIKEKIEEPDNLDNICKEINEIINHLDEEVKADTKVKKLIKDIEKLKSENYIEEIKKLINKKENLGVVKGGIKQLTKEIKVSGNQYLGEYFYFLYQTHGNINNNSQTLLLFDEFIERYRKEEHDDDGLTNKIRNRYIHREEHYLEEFKQICKVQGVNKITTEKESTLEEELENALFYVRQLKSQKGIVGECTMQKNKPRCPLSHPLYEEFRMWQFINNIKYKEKGNPNDMFKNLSYDDKMKIVPLFTKTTNFKFNDIIIKIDPILTKYEFNHQKYYEVNRKDSLTVEASPTIGRLVNIFSKEWELLKEESFKYQTTDRYGKIVDREIDIFEIWQILFRSKLTKKRENYLQQFAKEKLKLNEKKAIQFQNLSKKLKEGYANLSLNVISKILDFMKPENREKEVYIYSLAVFFANIKSVIGKEIWLKYKNQILSDIIQLLDKQQELNNKNDFINLLIRDYFDQPDEEKFYPYENYNLVSSEKKLIENKAINYVSKSSWEEALESFRVDFLKYAQDEYQDFLRKVKINGNKSEYFKKIYRKEYVIKQYLKNTYLDKMTKEELVLTFDIKNTKLTEDEIIQKQLKKLYHPSDIDFYPKAKMIVDEEGNTKLKLPSPYLPDIKNPVANRTLHKLKGLIEHLVNEGIINKYTQIHVEVAKEINGSNMRKAIQQYQNDRQLENENYRKLLEEFNKSINSDNTEKIILWKEQFENENDFNNDIKAFAKLKDLKKDLDLKQVRELDILKKRLWDEQKGICLYSGNTISMKQLFDDGIIEIEHTFPRSRIPDNSLENKTIAFKDENQKKGNKIPYELGSEKYSAIKKRLYFWEQKIRQLKHDYERLEENISKGVFSTPDKKDAAIQKKFLKRMELEYWTNKDGTGKYDRFIAKDIKKKFKNSQLNDTRIITKYASKYLETYFLKKPFIFQGSLVNTFRKEWGIQEMNEKKSRVKHIHHTIDAITISCMTYKYREILLKNHYAKIDNGEKSTLQVPINDFVNHIRNIVEKEVLVEDNTKDKISNQTYKKIRHRGEILHKEIYKRDSEGNVLKDNRNKSIVNEKIYRYKKGKRIASYKINGLEEGKDFFIEKKKSGKICYYEFVFNKLGERVKELVPLYTAGNTIRDRIHEDSFYGAIKQFDKKDGKLQKDEAGKILLIKDKENKDKINYVIRKPLVYDSSGNKGFKNIDQLKNENIVDPVVHEMILLQAKEAESFSKSFEIGYYMLKPKRKGKDIEKNNEGNIIFQKDIIGNYVKGPKINSIRVISKLTEPIKLKEHTFKSKEQHKHKESFYVNNKNNYLYVVYENSNKEGELKAVVSSLFEFAESQRDKIRVDDKPYPNNIEVLIGKSRINYNIFKRNNKDVVLKKNLHVLFKVNKEETIKDIIKLSDQEKHNRLYKIEALNKNLSYSLDKDSYVQFGNGQIKLRHHMISGNSSKNSEIEGLKDIYQRYFGNNKEMPESVTEFKIEYPFPFLLMSLNKMDCYIEGVDFKINVLGRLEKI